MGDFIGATGSFIEADAAYKASKYNAALARQNADWERQQTKEDVRQVNVQGRKVLGEMRASYGISGVTLEGSAFDVLQESAIAAKQDELNVKVEGARRALALEQGAQIEEYQGRVARLVGNIRGVAQIATGASKIAYPKGSA
jgi:hypothetical protein